MSRRILIRKAKENETRVKIIENHFCECGGLDRHKSLTALITKPNKTYRLRVCERDKGACIQKKLTNMKVKTDGKSSMQYSQVFTLKSEIALTYL